MHPHGVWMIVRNGFNYVEAFFRSTLSFRNPRVLSVDGNVTVRGRRTFSGGGEGSLLFLNSFDCRPRSLRLASQVPIVPSTARCFCGRYTSLRYVRGLYLDGGHYLLLALIQKRCPAEKSLAHGMQAWSPHLRHWKRTQE